MKYTNQFGETVDISSSDEVWLNDNFFAREMEKLPSEAPRAALAFRVSTKGQVDHDDIPMQKIECRKFCADHGWRVVSEKAEKGVSGSKVSASKRDAIQELKAEAEKGNFDILLVFMFDRLGRIESETPYVVEWFIKHDIQVWSTREGEQRIDSHTDKLINYIRFWQAAGESEKIAERVSTRIQQLNSSGHFTGGVIPYGYRAVNKGRTNKKGQPVKDLEIEPDEALVVQEVFRKTAEEGYSSYALADMLKDRDLRTHSGAQFSSNHILRILRHEGYTGYIITQNARSEYIPELQIIEPELFRQANKIIAQRCDSCAEAKRLARQADNPALLTGLVYCAHCGARMSGFMHKDRYKRRDGTVVENMRAKYNCFQRGQGLRDCDGQSIYLAERIDAAVLAMTRELFENIRKQPRDKAIEQKIRQESSEQRKKKRAAEKNLQTCEYALERYQAEVLKCLDGRSKFTEDMLARLIAQAETNLRIARQEYAEAVKQAENEKELAKRVQSCYTQFCGWADEFEMASTARKRVILSQLYDRIEVGRGYEITIHLNLSYRQLLAIAPKPFAAKKENTEKENIEDMAAHRDAV